MDALLLPWLAAVAAPMEALLARMHAGSYAEVAVRPAEPAIAVTSAPVQTSGAAPGCPSIAALERYCDGLAGYQLRVLGASSVAEPLRRALAARVLTLFVRHAALIRPLDDIGRQRLARDASQVSRPFQGWVQRAVATSLSCTRGAGGVDR